MPARQGDIYDILIGENLRRARRVAGYSQSQMAARLDPPVSRIALGYIESGSTRALVRVVQQWAQICNTTIDALLPDMAAAPIVEACEMPRLSNRVEIDDGLPCGGCDHRYGRHFETNDHESGGCWADKSDTPADEGTGRPAVQCECAGFLVRVRAGDLVLRED